MIAYKSRQLKEENRIGHKEGEWRRTKQNRTWTNV